MSNPRKAALAKKKAKKKKVSKAKPELVKKKKKKKKKKIITTQITKGASKKKKTPKRETTKVKLAKKKKKSKKKKKIERKVEVYEDGYPPFKNKRTIGTYSKHLLLKGRKSREVVAMVKKRFPESKISGAHIPHYRQSLRREGFSI